MPKSRNDFKIILNSTDSTSWNGSKYNAVYDVNINQIISDSRDLNKKYLMKITFISSVDNKYIEPSRQYFLGISLNNGNNNKHILTSQSDLNTGSFPITTVLRIVPDLTITYPRTIFQTITGTTSGSNRCTIAAGTSTLNLTTGAQLAVGQKVDLIGSAGTSGLTSPATYYIAGYNASATVVLCDESGVIPTLTNAAGLNLVMKSYSTFCGSSLVLDESDRAFTVIDNLYNLSQIRVNVFYGSTDTYTTYSTTSAIGTAGYTCCLHFEEIAD